jgi:hypothetical protein
MKRRFSTIDDRMFNKIDGNYYRNSTPQEIDRVADN